MAKYDWDKMLLQRYLLDPQIAIEFDGAFDFLDNSSKADNISMSLLRVLGADCNLFDLNPFLEESYNRIITPKSTLLLTRREKNKISIEEALKLTNTFYQSMDEDILQAFSTNFAKRFTNLKISNPTALTPKINYTGHCYSSETARDSLIQAWNTQKVDMICTLIHEYAHALTFTLRNYHYTPDCNIVFTEIESLFIKLLAMLWLYQNTPYKDGAFNEAIKLHNEILNTAKYSLEANDLCSIAKDMHSQCIIINLYTLTKQAEIEFTDMDKEYITQLLKTPMDMITPYGYSGLIAIELFFIYLQSPNDAFDLYKRIICMDTDTSIKMSYALNEMGITPGLHFEDFTRALKR